MAIKQDRHTAFVLASANPKSHSSTSSAASATSAGSTRSGGSKLLFGEIDTSSDRSSEYYASVCSFVLCDSGTFLTFWLNDNCRDNFLSYVPKKDLANLRLACHDFSVRAAPALFSDMSITFRANTFTKPSRLAALDRLGFYVKTLRFKVPHTADTYLPPLVEPETGAELSFTYTPQLQRPSPSRPRYGDAETTAILTRQYPPIFHAATNVYAFVRAFSAFVNLSHIKVKCPGYDPSVSYRRSVVDYALISLRIAIEQNRLNALDSLTLSPIHPGGLLCLSPLLGYAATPRSAKVWSQIRTLTIHSHYLPPGARRCGEPDHFKLLQTYLRTFQNNVQTFNFAWIGDKGPLPVQHHDKLMSLSSHNDDRHHLTGVHPARKPQPIKIATNCPPRKPVPSSKTKASRPVMFFPKLKFMTVENITASASAIAAFAGAHRRSVDELNFFNARLTSGTWDDAFAPLTDDFTAAQWI
ncbi:Hypothetical protein R9X50_00327700 [Acrodontium crateriforme]|uniref:Uncharacterized protein n=1 Tax=Acrodontium crateriforme TaxID=150365 RepID=A0AAQ3RBQ5_9PEZI|nr:Hypothetical protein R9X50_00327700 [Acrodontium crateriforme]